MVANSLSLSDPLLSFLAPGHLKLEEDLISEIASLQSSLSKEQEKAALLQHQVDHLLTRHTKEVSTRDDTIRQLNGELESKANMIALTTQQLYQARSKLKQEVEARSSKTSSCLCPHCHVHRKASPSHTDSRLSPLREMCSPPSLTEGGIDCTGSTTTTTGTITTVASEVMPPTAATAGRWLVPTPPPMSPHPPASSAPGRNHSIKKRAGTPIRRQSTPDLQSDHAPHPPQHPHSHHHHHHHHHHRLLRPAQATKQTGLLSAELQQLLSLKEVTKREAHTVLPPISSSEVSEDQTCFTALNPQRDQQCVHAYQAIQGVNSSSGSGVSSARHGGLILAKSKGLSSAPSTLRVLHYRPRPPAMRQELDHGQAAVGPGSGGRGLGGGAGAVEEVMMGEEEVVETLSAPEGTLLLVHKDSEQKGAAQQQQAAAEWDTCT